MPRCARIPCKSGIYHVILRGNERKEIFLEDEDKQRFFDILLEKRKKSNFSLYAYCIMDNHVHLIMNAKDEPLSTVIKRVGTSYAYYYNKKNKRVGHVFQDRFKSENIEDDAYLISAIRYTHNNPVKAAICLSAKDYKWSSMNLYLNYNKDFLLLPEISDILCIFSNNISTAKIKFIEFSNQPNEDRFMDLYEDNFKCDRDEAQKVYIEYLEKYKLNVEDIKKRENKVIINRLIKELARNTGLSGRQISNITGLNREKVRKIIVSQEPSP
jgi:REP element-mobilizing transposase RayT